ncbi:MAG: TolC family protein [Myxococcales bacterium]|nr:TolC family protein [Myxococcales bacterium]
MKRVAPVQFAVVSVMALTATGSVSPVAAQAVSEATTAPIDLSEAIQTALTHSPTAEAARQTKLSAEARIGTVRSSWLPQLTLSGSVRGDYSYQIGGMNTQVTTLRSSGQLALNQMIYDFGRVGGRISAAQASAQAAQTDERNVQSQVVLGAMSGFYAVLQAEALLSVASENQQQQLRRLKQAESFFKIGTKPQIDVLIAQTAVAQARLQVLQATGNVQVARTQFLQSLGLPESEWPRWQKRPVSSLLPPPHALESQLHGASAETVATIPDATVDAALRTRPDFQSLQSRVRAAEAQLKAARADYFPTLSIGANASLSSGTIGGISGLDVTTQQSLPGLLVTGTLGLNWPVLTGLSTVYAVRDAQAQLSLAQANLQQLRLQVRSQLQQALQQVLTAWLTVEASVALANQAKKQLEMADGRYRAGVGNAIELGDAQVSAMQAQAQQVQADFALALQRANLRFYLGELISETEPRGGTSP